MSSPGNLNACDLFRCCVIDAHLLCIVGRHDDLSMHLASSGELLLCLAFGVGGDALVAQEPSCDKGLGFLV